MTFEYAPNMMIVKVHPQTASILQSACCLVPVAQIPLLVWLPSTVQKRRTFKSTTNKSTIEYALINMIVEVHLQSINQ